LRSPTSPKAWRCSLSICIFSPKRTSLQVYRPFDNIVSEPPTPDSYAVLRIAGFYSFQLLYGMGSGRIVGIALENMQNFSKSVYKLPMLLYKLSECAVEVGGRLDGENLHHALDRRERLALLADKILNSANKASAERTLLFLKSSLLRLICRLIAGSRSSR